MEKIDINEIGKDEKIKNFYIYFIESHHFTLKNKVYLSPNYPEAKSLERIEEISLKKDSTTYSTSIYRFKASPFKEENESLKIISEDINQEKNEFELSQILLDKNFFLFDFNSYLNIFETKLSLNEEFDIYINFLKGKRQLSKDSDEFKDFLNSIFYFLIQTNQIIDFSFYISLFLECFNTGYFINLLQLFTPEKIKDQAELSQNKIEEFKKILPDLENFQNLGEIGHIVKEQLTINLYSVMYFFCLKYHQEKLQSLFENIHTEKYILKGLLKHQLFFHKIVFQKNLIEKLVKISDSLFDLINALSYNRDFFTLLEVINENIELFNQKIEGQEISLINVEKLIIPKREDDINKIYSEMQKLFENEKKYNKKFIKFSPNTFDTYIMFFDSKNIENINILSRMIKDLKERNPNFEVKNDADFFIHENTIFFATQHKLRNMEILNFIQNDKFYNDDKYQTAKYRSTEIIKGIDISQINQEFIKKWKEIDFVKIFNYNYFEFLNEVCRLIVNIADFGILFHLLNKIGENEIYNTFHFQTITLLQKTFDILLKTYEPEGCPNFANDVSDLIYYTDLVKFHVKEFLKDNLQKNLSNNLLNSIYFKFLSRYPNISDEALDVIIDFFTENNWNTNVSTLLELIKISQRIKDKLMGKLDKYVIKEDEFFEIEETNNYKLLSGLIKSDNFFQNEDNIEEGEEYLLGSMMVITSLMQNVKNLDINYNLINYFIENKKEDILYERLLIIFLMNEKDAKEQKDLLIKNVDVIKNSLNKLQSSLDQVTIFFPNKYHKEIIELNDIIKEIKLCTIKSYVKEYSYQYNNYITKFRADVEKIGKRSESCFFITVYNDIKAKNKFDDEKCFTKAISQFNKMKEIFSKNVLADSYENILDLCLKPFKYKEEQLKKEIDIDIEILNIKKIKDKEKLYQDLLVLLKRIDIINTIEALKDFVNQMGAIKGDFIKEIDIRLKKLHKGDITKVKKAIELLLKYDIDIEKKK